MLPVSETAIRACLVNCTKGEAKRLAVPRDLADRPWPHLDFLGWRDPAARERAYLVAETPDGLVGVALRVAPQSTQVRRGMCSLCLTTHPGTGVSLMTARKPRESTSSVGTYICTDLACSLYLRGKKPLEPGGRVHETLTLAEKIDRTTTNLAGFLNRVRE
ncbi:FBP domain-containing protein [Actinokineospora terrae]|uniref:FBP C-terminal treble-clef zinc-finger n=1 Tax=Actinokineospora terrae TaxID=155974 RepID=A0A1H9MKX6_9PSEU|nr:FBP domain-containing protein [Actinokineospora terrae]SER24189.1 FBP C-terminal treble-clef zinc-finger [Actinokineospora terrae]